MIKAFWYKSNNVGDTLTPFVVEHFTGQKVEFVPRSERNKLLGIGSIMRGLLNGDVVWGTGIMRETDVFLGKDNCKFLAVRGKLTEKILGKQIGVYGDPALLLPLMYSPKIEKKYKIGVIPHYVDMHEDVFKSLDKDHHIINVLQPWKSFVDEVLSCEVIHSSSLHGLIIAEAYGIPAMWFRGSNKIIGKGFKFRDYLTGTGRDENITGDLPPIQNLKEIQLNLIRVLQEHYGNK